MDAASWSASLPLIITFGLGILGLWFAIRTEVARVRAELRAEIREVRTELRSEIRGVRTELRGEIRGVDHKLDGINVRVSEFDLEQARQEGMMRILGLQTHTHESKSDPTDDA